MKKVIVAFVVFLALASPVRADLILAGDAGGVQFCATDNNTACAYGVQIFDIDPTPDTLSLASTNIGGLQVEGSLHTSIADGVTNILSSSSLSIINTTIAAINLLATIGATDFIGPATEAFTTGSGTWVSSIGSNTTYTWWNDPLNNQSGETATDREGNLIDAFFDVAGAQTLDSFSHNGGPFAINNPGAFSMALGFDMTLLAGDSLISRGQSQIADVAIPEPASLFLVGTGALLLFRRRFIKH